MVFLLLVLTLMLMEASSSGTTITFFREPSASFVKRYLERRDEENISPNHQYAGFSDPTAADAGAAPPPAPPGFQERTVRVYLGSGKEAFERGQDALLRPLKVAESTSYWCLSLTRKRRTRDAKRNGHLRNMVTVAKASAGLAWCVNPCQIVYERRNTVLRFVAPPRVRQAQSPSAEEETPRNRGRSDKRARKGRKRGKDDRLWAGKSPSSSPEWATFLPGWTHKGRQSAVAYATSEGHLIEGEERMRVLHFCGRGGDDSVWFEVYSVSRGAGLAGSVLFPFVQSMQRRFFQEQALTMRRIVGAPEAAVA
ncbi:unnamed protein product [Scytosiphon promiscuus]